MGDHEYESLKQCPSFDAMKPSLREYIRQQIKRYKDNPDNAQAIAYELAGLLSLPQLADIPEGNPYVEVLFTRGTAGAARTPPRSEYLLAASGRPG